MVYAWAKADATYSTEVGASEKRPALAARRGPLEQAEDLKRQAAALIAGVVTGPDVDEEGNEWSSAQDQARSILADLLSQESGDPLLYRAVVQPDAPPPAPTLRDAVNLDVRDKLTIGDGGVETKEAQRVERVFARMSAALGRLDQIAIADLRHNHGTLTVAHYLKEKTKAGKSPSIESIRREMNIAKAVVNYAIRGFDLENTAKNPFAKLLIARRGETAPGGESEKREPLPEAVIKALSEGLQQHDHRLIWRMLVGTGCRLAGPTVEDVDLTADIPHIRVRWNENRRLKTIVSIRSAPLLGDALAAAMEAVSLPRSGTALFPRYGRKNGPTAASQILMRYTRPETANFRLVPLRGGISRKAVATVQKNKASCRLPFGIELCPDKHGVQSAHRADGLGQPSNIAPVGGRVTELKAGSAVMSRCEG